MQPKQYSKRGGRGRQWGRILPAGWLILLLAAVTGTQAQSSPTTISGTFFIYSGSNTQWYGDVTLGPGAQLYIQDGETVTFNGGHFTIDPSAKVYGFNPAFQATEGGGTAVLLFQQPNPLDNSTVQQTLDGGNNAGLGGMPSLMNIGLDNTLGMALTGNNTRITGTLAFTNGSIALGSQNLQMGPAGLITGFNNTNYAITDGTGNLVKEGLASSSAFTFPVGRAASDYTPAILTNTGGAADDYYMQVKSYAESAATITGPANGMDRSWHIYSTTGGTAGLSLTHNTSTDGSAFSEALAFATQQTTAGSWLQGPPANSSGNPVNSGVTGGTSTQSRAFTLATSPAADASWFSKSSDALNPLPLKLLSFTAQAVNDQSLLRWVTTEEHNTSYFMVQRSVDGTGWNDIGKVAARGESAVNQSYSLIDANPNTGLNYYRLLMADIDGHSTYSPICQLSFDKRKDLAMMPNPARSLVRVVLPAAINGQSRLKIYNAIGQSVLEQDATGLQVVEFNVSGLAAGIYQVVIMDSKKVLYTRQLIKE
jgi:hypothetical protein